MKFARRTSWLKRAALAPFSQTRVAGSSVWLTFDDGPHPEHTPAVLDRLAAFNVRAAFFLVGRRIADPALVTRITSAEHALGNHTFEHELPGWLDIQKPLADLRKCQDLVPNATLFRPALGKLRPGAWIAAQRLGLKCVHWSLDSGDWQCRSESDAVQCAREVLELVRPGDIVLFHDDHDWISTILDVVLPALAARQLLPNTASTTQHPRT